jgi:hypothetical protein
MATAPSRLAQSHWDCVFDNMMDGICQIESKRGWKWTESFMTRNAALRHRPPGRGLHATTVDDILRAHREGGDRLGGVDREGSPIENGWTESRSSTARAPLGVTYASRTPSARA